MSDNKGIEILNIKAATLVGYNIGVRDRFDYTKAVLNHSLFLDFMKNNRLNVYKGKSTRDIICLDFDFGTRSYEDEKTRLQDLKKSVKETDEFKKEKKERFDYLINRLEKHKDLVFKQTKEEIRDDFYKNGVSITYNSRDRNGEIAKTTTIKYRMLYRSSAKAKLGQVMFINEKLYKKAYKWLTMGLGNKMSKENAKIVEMAAYAPLTTSTIVGEINIPVENILILKDQDSLFKTIANVVEAKEIDGVKQCTVAQKETDVKNTVWDGLGLVDSSVVDQCDCEINGMVLTRQHFFKVCFFVSHIQLFFKDWCRDNGHDYNTYEVEDMFGNKHLVKNIKAITTNNAIKWTKFSDLMGKTLNAAYLYWCNKVNQNGSMFGIVKTDHGSKLGEYQQMSYQMINTLPCTKEDIADIATDTIEFINKMKADNDHFVNFLRKNATIVNHYGMLVGLYDHNNAFANSDFFRYEKRQIIRNYMDKIRSGKLFVKGDNLTVCGNPYGLLLHSVGEDFTLDNTLQKEDGVIQCYTTKFEDGEYLCAFRNPHNSPNNIMHFKNVYSDKMEKYFRFSNNIMAVNCIKTDVQDRANSMDFDSDFVFVTNQPTMVKCASECHKEYFTIVNDLKESGVTYNNTLEEYAKMDNKFSNARNGIGESSNLAQLAMTYYWTEVAREEKDEKKIEQLYNNFVILSVLAQIIIDGCKREYEIDALEEIKRIKKMNCMKPTVIDKNGNTVYSDLPSFMKYTKSISFTKNGKDRPYEDIKKDKTRLANRINNTLVCPMNWMVEALKGVNRSSKEACTPTKDFFIKQKGRSNDRQVTKMFQLVEEFDGAIKKIIFNGSDESIENMIEEIDSVMDKLSKIKMNQNTINRIIELSLGLETVQAKSSKTIKQYRRKTLNLLYNTNKDVFIKNFVKANDFSET